MSSLPIGRHFSKNMVGNINANFNISLVTRYMHKPKHYKRSDVNIMSLLFTMLAMFKRIDNQFAMKPRAVYWSLWGSAIFVFAIATISLEMRWISSLMENWN